MAGRTEAEMALRSFAIDLMALAEELGVGAVSLYADPEPPRFATGCAWAPGREKAVASFSEFLDGGEGL